VLRIYFEGTRISTNLHKCISHRLWRLW